MDPVILIPAYEPDHRLIELLRNLRALRAEQIIIVINDGSSEKTTHIFQALSEFNVILLRHAVNLGKGQALKTGFNYCLAEYPNASGVVTADADGQHAVIDIYKVVDALKSQPHHLHLGVRNFSQQDIPLRSRFGNILTGFIFRQISHTRVHDTQTGLRGIPDSLLAELLRSKLTGYDFELEMLILATKNKLPITETSISTIYIDDNASSHFNPLLDSMKIYFVFLRFSAISLSSAVLDFLIFFISYRVSHHVFIAIVCGRLLSGFFNYKMNRRVAFKAPGGTKSTALKYISLAAFLALLAYGLVTVFTGFGINVIVAKIIAECLLFIVSFCIQKIMVFNRWRFEAE